MTRRAASTLRSSTEHDASRYRRAHLLVELLRTLSVRTSENQIWRNFGILSACELQSLAQGSHSLPIHHLGYTTRCRHLSATDRTKPMSKPQQFDNWPESIQPGFGPYRAVCERIVDGDTLYAFCDLGLSQYSYQSLRLEDVFAPELFSGTNREAGAEARDYLASICPPGTKLQMYTQKDASTFGRYVATLKTADGTIVN